VSGVKEQPAAATLCLDDTHRSRMAAKNRAHPTEGHRQQDAQGEPLLKQERAAAHG